MIKEGTVKPNTPYAYCARCRKGSEPKVCACIRDKYGYEAYAPVYQMVIVRRENTHVELRPLTPGYILFYSDVKIEKDNLQLLRQVVSVVNYSDGSCELSGDDYSYAMWIHRHCGIVGLSQAVVNETNKGWIDFVSGPITELGRVTKVDRRHRFAVVEREFMGEAKTYALSFEWIA